MNTVALEGMEFFAFHGYYEQERQIGNRYTVDVSIDTDFSEASSSDELQGTVNYEKVYKIVASEMEQPSKLLEHIAHRIIEKIQAAFGQAECCQVTIVKHNPPLGGVCKQARITIRKRLS
jgi:7,8-dihydroneopterin aldolase/epimerase/oxygenase